MASFRTFSEIVSSMIERLRLTQPNLDTKPGTVSRDLFIDIQADQIDRLYRSIAFISEKQSLGTTSGRDLDRLAANFGVSRNSGTAATGIVIFATNSLSTDISISTGTIVRARNGMTFRVVGNYVMSSAEKSRFSANANRMRQSLNLAGLTSQYAIEVSVQATRPGTSGNVASMQVVSSDLPFPASVVNLMAISGGANREVDSSFRTRILSIFSGANTGTANGYRSAAKGSDNVLDALVVEPGSSLMLRDGTETIETNDGTSRIISSGTGGKVDIYVLGKSLEEVSESFIFTDLSGSGDASDERNDVILGQETQDPERTSEERRYLAFKTGNLPMQPVDTIASVTGSKSGLFAEASTDDSGVVTGNYELVKDYNPDTGGSPFGFDYLHFISAEKSVDGEVISKPSLNSADSLRYLDVTDLSSIYQDISIVGENASVSSSGKSYIQLNHYPVKKVSRVVNSTTGEIYVIESQNLDEDTGLNEDGVIEISGRSLPSSADVLRADYTWRRVFDKYIDYGGFGDSAQFVDDSKADVIDWGTSNGVFREESIIEETEDGLARMIMVENEISRIVSVFLLEKVSSKISIVSSSGGQSISGIELDAEDDVIEDIVSIIDSNGLEIYNTKEDDGSFSSRTIYIPSDAVATLDDEVTVYYNKVEIFDIDGTDASFGGNIITIPSSDILSAAEIDDAVESVFLSEDVVYIKYVANISSVFPNVSLGSLPISGSSVSNILLDSSFTAYENSMQPVCFEYEDDVNPSSILIFGPTQLSVSTTNLTKAGKIKVAGVTLTRAVFEVDAGVSMSGLEVGLKSEMRDMFDMSTLPDTIGIARVDRVSVLDSNNEVESDYDTLGCAVLDNVYSIGSAIGNEDLYNYQFTLPSTPNNSSINVDSGDTVQISVLIYNTDDTEELYFSSSSTLYTAKRFARIDRVSVQSGFRTATGNLSGSISIGMFNQPLSNSIYYANYSFEAPKEGERITVSYNMNKVILDATQAIESVRPITADVLVKEAAELDVDVYGTVLVNDNAINNADTVVQNVANAVVSLLSTSKLGTVIDYSDIISVATAISGVDSVNISLFNESGEVGRRAFIKSLDNQYISPGTIVFEVVSREKFRIS